MPAIISKTAESHIEDKIRMFVTVTNIIYKRINAHGYGDNVNDYVSVQQSLD